MKKLKSLGTMLSKQEMQKIIGGDYGGGDVRSGKCNDQAGCWQYINPVSYSTCQQDLATYCSSGHGGCYTIHISC